MVIVMLFCFENRTPITLCATSEPVRLRTKPKWFTETTTSSNKNS